MRGPEMTTASARLGEDPNRIHIDAGQFVVTGRVYAHLIIGPLVLDATDSPPEVLDALAARATELAARKRQQARTEAA